MDSEASAKWKEVTLWQGYYQVLTQRNSIWEKDLITYNSHLWIMFSFNFLDMIWRREDLFDNGDLRSRGWKNFGCKWTSGRESGSWVWTIFMDVICVLSYLINRVVVIFHCLNAGIFWKNVNITWPCMAYLIDFIVHITCFVIV